MTIYGKAAIDAVDLLRKNPTLTPESAWAQAIRLYTDSPSSQEKCCPKGAFLGLCIAGLVKHVLRMTSESPSANGRYAIAMAKALQASRDRPLTQAELWAQVPHAPDHENGQIEVVLALWQEGLIKR